MALSENLTKRLLHAVGDTTLGLELVNAINLGTAAGAQDLQAIAGLIIATNVSQTIDFGILRVNDQVLMIPATAGSADQIGPIVTAGTLGQAAVVGNAYLVLRAFVPDASSTVKL